ncbi:MULTISPECIES: hypothetical protein [unclassified Mycobacterium]|uniref:hypothetical protein n=1 Tax=unclassified Mycobacterium TaxID=2642494 RepID=UPI00073FD072|nr:MULTISPECIES: hypothetical protein [unclassified Mycobacterium]KUH81656.1 hypothetical protein AU185_16360 [Mycobacterium sp. GA-0227b]KUH83799.1 hypothetical protein AU186_16055 [Mycobacterium sp. GA-1999]KUH84881.1 hypothetical protein AU187_19140 [Mycobacterium sp. IS-1556]
MDTTPQAAAAATKTMPLPDGDDERVVGFGVMGLPFASGHYLAYRDFPETSFSPAYKSVWHRTPDGVWTFYATTPGPQSCSRYFSSATTIDPIVCGIDAHWPTPWSLAISIAGLLDWRVDIEATAATRLMSAVGSRLPAAAARNRETLRLMSRLVGPVLGIGKVRLTGSLPNGQEFRIAPKRVWAVADSTAVVRGVDLGPVGPHPVQGNLADFQLPQRGICVVAQGRFEPFDVARHRDADRLRLSH